MWKFREEAVARCGNFSNWPAKFCQIFDGKTAVQADNTVILLILWLLLLIRLLLQCFVADC